MTIAVIGHGRSPEGRHWGERIDSCDAVVRMWDWFWQPNADYGEKYDYGVVALIPFSLEPFHKAPKAIPRIAWLGYARGKGETPVLPNMEIIDQRYRDEAVRLGGRPGMNLTRGCAAVCWAIEAADEVVLVGFDNLKARACLDIDAAFCPDYQALWDRWHPGWRGRLYSTKRQGSHDVAIERPLIEALARKRGVTVAFAEDIWN